MKITLRKRSIANSNQSLYLDYYDAGTHRTESLGLFLTPENTHEAKLRNEQTLRRAIAIRAERVLASENGKTAATKSPLMTEWMEEYLNRLSPTLAPRTFNHHVVLVRNVREFLEYKHKRNLRVGQFDKKLYSEFINYMRNVYRVNKCGLYGKPEPLEPSTLFVKQRHLNRMMNAAVRDGWISINPYRLLNPNEKLKNHTSPRTYLTREEVKQIMEAPIDSVRVKNAFLFCCFTGLRFSDLVALTWGDIHKSNTGKEIWLRQKKTKGMAIIPLNKYALMYLPDRARTSPKDRIFDLPSGSSVRMTMNVLARHAGIQKHINFHTSRHTFATLTLSTGVDIFTVSKLLGHKSVKTTEIYAEVIMQSKVEAVNKFVGSL